MKKKKVVLLNPPSETRVMRDYYCSHIAKGCYGWPSLDLLVLSGALKEQFTIKVIDALAAGQTPAATIAMINEFAPDCIIAVAGAASWKQDMAVLKELKQQNRSRIIISGDYPKAEPALTLDSNSFIDAVILDFTDTEVEAYIEDPGRTGLMNIYSRADRNPPCGDKTKVFSLATPCHELFALRSYHLPHVRHHPFATLMTDFGCPFHCSFCPFERIGYKLRDMDNIRQEIIYLASLRIKELWLRDQSFGSHREHALAFCRMLGSVKHAFSWSCEMRVDAASSDLLQEMKAAGCHTVMFGVETASQEVLAKHNKDITIEQIKGAFSLARENKLATLAHFIIGLDGETRDSMMALIDFSLSLKPDYASFNIAAPLWSTTFRDRAVTSRLINRDQVDVDSSCSYPVWEPAGLKRGQIWQLRNLAVRRFYLRPAYLARRIAGVKSWYQLTALFREGAYFAKKELFSLVK